MTLGENIRLMALPLLLGLSGCVAVDANEVGAAAAGEAATVAPAKFDRSDADPALWVIKDDDTTIYLFGTIHFLKPDLVWFDDAVADAFEASDELVKEVIFPDDAIVQQTMLEMGVARDGKTLRERLNVGQLTRYEAALASLNLAPQSFDAFEPWLAVIVLTQMQFAKNDFLPQAGVEQVLAQRAKSTSKPSAGVETLEEQIGFFDSLPEKDQIAFLMAGIDGMEEFGSSLDRMERAWATADIKGLGDLMNEGFEATPTLGKILLTDRNARWAVWLDERMDRPGTVFMAVGAGHLAGENSVQAFLAQRGLVAKRIVY